MKIPSPKSQTPKGALRNHWDLGFSGGPMQKTLLIFNPMADRGRSGQQASDLRAMVDEMGGADWQGTEYPAHATEIAAQAALQGYQTIVALGGDGTGHATLNRLINI